MMMAPASPSIAHAGDTQQKTDNCQFDRFHTTHPFLAGFSANFLQAAWGDNAHYVDLEREKEFQTHCSFKKLLLPDNWSRDGKNPQAFT
jgi:hypothetical protein